MTVTLVVFSKKAFELSGNIVEKVREYVDSQYVMSAEEKEYSKRLNLNLPPEEIEYIKENLRRKRENEKSAPRLPKEKIDIKTFIASPEKTFQQRLFDIIDARGLTGPQVYKNYISKQVYSKIQADIDYHPNKYTAIALCLSLHLDLDETKDLIGRAGWTLSNSNKSDLVVSACIMNGEYDVVEINLILYDNDCPELEKIK